jgi:nucleolin
VQVRWLTDKDTGDFRGCGFIEFATPADADKAVTLHGKELKGRAVKIDWAE